MENDKLKSIWNSVPTAQKSNTELTEMLKERNHPLLKAIKNQALFELVAFSIFLFCYYSMFDGTEKPLLINFLLVFAIAVNMFHHLKGYRLQQYFRASENIKDDLKSFAAKMKTYQLETIISKIVLVSGLATFFTYGIQFTEKKWLAIGIIVIIFTIQLILLNRIWMNRIRKIKATIGEFEKA